MGSESGFVYQPTERLCRGARSLERELLAVPLGRDRAGDYGEL